MILDKRRGFRHTLIGTLLSAMLIVAASAQNTTQFTPGRQINVPITTFFIGPADLSSAQMLGSPHAELLTRQGPHINVNDTHAGPSGLGTNTVTIVFGAWVESFVVGDVDADGDDDLAAKLANGNVAIARNLGGGTFGITNLPTAPTVSAPVHMGDLDGNGSLDIVCSHRMWLNDGIGGFPAATTISIGTTSPIDVLPGDFDGDGDLDLVSIFSTSNAPGPGVVRRFLRNNANGGTFSLLTSTLLEATVGTSVFPLVADMNGDGRDDLILSSVAPSLHPNHAARRFRTFLGQTPIALTALAPTDIDEALAAAPALADWNGDGFLDLAMTARAIHGGNLGVSYTSATVIGMLLNDGSGAVLPGGGRGVENVNYYSGYPYGTTVPVLLGAIDDDLDGTPDLAVNYSLPTVSIFRNDSTTSGPLPTMIDYPTSGFGVVRSYGSESFVDVNLEIVSPVYGGEAAGHFVRAEYIDPSGTILRQTLMTAPYGLAKIRVPNGYPPTMSSFTMTISTPEATLGTFEVLLNAAVTMTGGTGQANLPYQTLSPALTGVVTSVTGVPVPGVPVVLEQVSGPAVTSFPLPVFTDANGQFSTTFLLGLVGNYEFRCRVSPTIVSPIFSMTVLAPTTAATVVQGSPQAVCPGVPITPVIVNAVSNPGQPLVGQTITLTQIGSGPSPVAFASNQSTTDGAGNATFTGIGTGQGTSASYEVRISNFPTTAVVTIMAPTAVIEVVAGGNQAVDLGEAPAPITFSFADCGGVPLVGQTVTLTAQTGGIAVPSSTAVTDGLGRVTVSPTVSVTGLQRLQATLGNSSAKATVFVRGLTITSAPTALLFTFRHEHSGVLLLLAVDVPTPSPYLTTPYGEIWTSVLTPQPTLAVLDGFGIFGSIDPGMTTNPTGIWARAFGRPSMPLNLSFIAQMYGYDNQNVFPDDYIVSNPVIFNL